MNEMRHLITLVETTEANTIYRAVYDIAKTALLAYVSDRSYPRLKAEIKAGLQRLVRSHGDPRHPLTVMLDYIRDDDSRAGIAYTPGKRAAKLAVELKGLLAEHPGDAEKTARLIARVVGHEWKHYNQYLAANWNNDAVTYGYTKRVLPDRDVPDEESNEFCYLARSGEIHTYAYEAAHELVEALGSLDGVLADLRRADGERLATASMAFRRYWKLRQSSARGTALFREFLRALIREILTFDANPVAGGDV